MCKALRESAETGNYLEEPARWLVIDGKNWQEEAKIFAVESEGSGCCVGQVDTGINYLQHSSSFPVLKIASCGVNITKIGRFENHYVFLSKPMVDDRALQSDERDARVIMPRWDFATFMQMQPNGRACAQ
jgi:hypothetical protein